MGELNPQKPSTVAAPQVGREHDTDQEHANRKGPPRPGTRGAGGPRRVLPRNMQSTQGNPE